MKLTRNQLNIYFNSNNPSVYVDEELTDFYDLDIQNKYKKNAIEGKYKRSHKTSGYMHPICVTSKDYLQSGGYSGNWDMDFFSGYGRDDMFAATLYSLHKGNFRFALIDWAALNIGKSKDKGE
jgi:hypothetical protein